LLARHGLNDPAFDEKEIKMLKEQFGSSVWRERGREREGKREGGAYDEFRGYERRRAAEGRIRREKGESEMGRTGAQRIWEPNNVR
jgi:hypothetical protein